ncbi:hypothetical protein P5E51_16055, partial [Clostridium perfringens]|nr:hypothetical protein [Clostridium perfringens]
ATMKTVLILSGLVALAMGVALPKHHEIQVKPVDAAFAEHQKKILALFEHSEQLDVHAEYYKVGKEYDIEANIAGYTEKHVVEEFLQLQNWILAEIPQVFHLLRKVEG